MTIERKTCRAADGVEMVYSVCGAGAPSLLFIHGGLSDRTFWDHQLQAFGPRHRVVALDLPGYGESGTDRTQWGMPEFGSDIAAVARAEDLEQIVLLGNSLGGPAAIEAALLMPERVIGVVGVDTFHRLDYSLPPDQARERAQAFRQDYAASLRQMVKILFQPDADPAAAASHLTVPLRAINGDLFPTDMEAVRRIKPDFEVSIMQHMGHYPMLERPDEFNACVAAVVESMVEPRLSRHAAH